MSNNLNLYKAIKYDNEPMHRIATMEIDGLSADFVDGYIAGWEDAINRVLKMIRTEPDPPKSSGHPDWNKHIKTLMNAAPDSIRRDRAGTPYVS